MSLPFWARKPKHKKEVVATDRGWELKGTGELLTSVRGLKTMLADLHGVAVEEKVVEPTISIQPVVLEGQKTRVQEYIDNQNKTEKVVEEKPKSKGRGRPKGSGKKTTRRGRPPKNSNK